MSRLADLKDRLAARKRTPGFERNVEALEQEIKRLEGKIAD